MTQHSSALTAWMLISLCRNQSHSAVRPHAAVWSIAAATIEARVAGMQGQADHIGDSFTGILCTLTWTGILCIIGGMDERTSTQAGPLMIGALVAIIDQELRRRVTAALHTSGFPDYRSTYRSIFMWTRAEGSRITELAELAQITQQSMSELVAELERRGYVERIPDPTDRRAVLVRRTERGWHVNAISRQAVAAGAGGVGGAAWRTGVCAPACGVAAHRYPD